MSFQKIYYDYDIMNHYIPREFYLILPISIFLQNKLTVNIAKNRRQHLKNR